MRTPPDPSPDRNLRFSAEHRRPGPPGTLVPGKSACAPALFASLQLCCNAYLLVSRRPRPGLVVCRGLGLAPPGGEGRAPRARDWGFLLSRDPSGAGEVRVVPREAYFAVIFV